MKSALLVAAWTTIAMLGGMLTGCAPSAEQLAVADYGLRPSDTTAKAIAQSYISERLKDPESARIRWGSIEQSWFRQMGGKTRFAWRLPASVNAKNSYGGYTGDKPWAFFFRGDQLVGIGEPYTHVGRFDTSTDLIYVEMPGVQWPQNN